MRSNSLFSDLKRTFDRNGNSLHQLILVNVLVFVGLSLVSVGFALFQLEPGWYTRISRVFAIPAYLPNLLLKPWSVVTYMFVHAGFFHILFNMLWLFWIGQILQEYLGNKKLVGLYFLGGFAGALLYILSYNFFPLFANALRGATAVGASASVLAVVVGTATLLPNYTIRMFLIGNVPLKYLALAMVVLDLLSLAGANAGGHFAHLGGAIFGFVYIRQLQGGRDLAAGFNRFLDWLVMRLRRDGRPTRTRSSKLKVSYKQDSTPAKAPAGRRKVPQEVIDGILDKIAQGGYDALTKEEKAILFNASKQD